MKITNVLEFLKGACGVNFISDLKLDGIKNYAIDILNDIKHRVDNKQLQDAYNYLGVI